MPESILIFLFVRKSKRQKYWVPRGSGIKAPLRLESRAQGHLDHSFFAVGRVPRRRILENELPLGPGAKMGWHSRRTQYRPVRRNTAANIVNL